MCAIYIRVVFFGDVSLHSCHVSIVYISISVVAIIGYRFLKGAISLSSVLYHHSFWRGPYRFTVFRARL